MADLCRSCARRAQRSATSVVHQNIQRRAFTATSLQQKRVGPPIFTETSKPELDDVLLTLRNSHFIPAYLNKRQRHLIFGDKFKTELENTPAYASLGEEEVQLQHIDRRHDIPARKPLVRQALALMQENEDWKQLPSLLEGLHKGGSTSDRNLIEKIVRKAIEAGQLGVVVRCLKAATVTGLTLKNESVLNLVMWGLHQHAQDAEWDEAHVRKAIRYGDELAQLLESNEHGTGRLLAANDARIRPSIIAIYLELSAVLALKYQEGRDVDGSVKKYAERLMACIDGTDQLASQEASKFRTEFFTKFPVWHALSLSKRVLGNDLPQSAKAQRIISDYEVRLAQLVEVQTGAKSTGYSTQISDAWNAAIRS